MTLVVDASVAALWVIEQQGSAAAAAIRNEDGLIAPSLVVSEICSAIWKAVRRGNVKRADALTAIEAALLPFEQLIPDGDLRVRALELAVDLSHPVYDCFYLALAERERCGFVTADARLLTAARRLTGIELRAL